MTTKKNPGWILVIVLVASLAGFSGRVQASTVTTDFFNNDSGASYILWPQTGDLAGIANTVAGLGGGSGGRISSGASFFPLNPIVFNALSQPGEYTQVSNFPIAMSFSASSRGGDVIYFDHEPTPEDIAALPSTCFPFPVSFEIFGDIWTTMHQSGPGYIDKITYSYNFTINGKTFKVNFLTGAEKSDLNFSSSDENYTSRIDCQGDLGDLAIPITWDIYPEESFPVWDAIPSWGYLYISGTGYLTETVHVVPLPSTFLLLGSGLLSLEGLRKYRKT